MRIWDVSPGYLNRQSLLGEHRELHGMVSILVNGKKGYSRHPETLRWVDCHWGLAQRHALLAAEMALRGYTDRSPVVMDAVEVGCWPSVYIDEPNVQYELLREKYVGKVGGRIPLPHTVDDLWQAHRHSFMARDMADGMQAKMARLGDHFSMSEMALDCDRMLKVAPTRCGVTDAVWDLWESVELVADINRSDLEELSVQERLLRVRKIAIENEVRMEVQTTAIGELMAWI